MDHMNFRIYAKLYPYVPWYCIGIHGKQGAHYANMYGSKQGKQKKMGDTVECHPSRNDFNCLLLQLGTADFR